MQLSAFSLSKDTVSKRKDDMFADILDQVMQKKFNLPYFLLSIKIDKSTYAVNCPL